MIEVMYAYVLYYYIHTYNIYIHTNIHTTIQRSKDVAETCPGVTGVIVSHYISK